MYKAKCTKSVILVLLRAAQQAANGNLTNTIGVCMLNKCMLDLESNLVELIQVWPQQ